MRGSKKVHSPTGAPRLENAWGVDFEPLHGPRNLLKLFPWEPQPGGGLEPPERPRGTL